MHQQADNSLASAHYMTPFAIAKKGYYPRKPGDVEVNVNDHLCLLSRVDSTHYQVLNKQTKCQGRVPAEVLSIMVDLPADNMSTNGPTNSPSSPTVKPPGPAPPLPPQNKSSTAATEPARNCGQALPRVDTLPHNPPSLPSKSRRGQLNSSSSVDSGKDHLRHSDATQPSPSAFAQSSNSTSPTECTPQCRPHRSEFMAPFRISIPATAAMRDLAWLIVENSEAWVNGENTLPVRDGEVLRWIDYEEDVLYGDAVLDKDAYVECEKWTGEGVVLPAAFVRVLYDKLELAACLSKRPRAQLIADYISKKPKELLLKKGDIVYLHREMDDGFFFASNKIGQKCVVPSSFLNILTPCRPPTPL